MGGVTLRDHPCKVDGEEIFGRQDKSQGKIRLDVAQKIMTRHVHHLFYQS